MESTRTARMIALLLAGCLLLWIPATAQSGQDNVIVRQPVKHDVSLPMRDLARSATPLQPGQARILTPGQRPNPFISTSTRPDPVAQRETLPDVNTTNLLNFDGQVHAIAVPPDTNGAAGATQFVQTVNLTWAVYDKATGGLLMGPTPLNNIWSGFGGLCQTVAGGDPIVLYDKTAQRWLISELAYNGSFTSNFICVAVSTSNDATGSYNRYAFSFGTTIPDYPKYSVWPDAYYLNVNGFGNGGFTYLGAQPCALDRAAMLAGNPSAALICFAPRPLDYSFLPGDMEGATPPPAGAANNFIELWDSRTLHAFKFHVDFVTPANSTFTGPTNITIPNWVQICPTTRACIPQPSPGEMVDSIGNRLMFRMMYRNFGDHETLTASHTVKPASGTAVAATRWYELRNASVGGNFTVFQGGTFQNAKISLWMGSIAMDKVGDIALGMSASSSTVKPSVVYTGRTPSDPKNKMESPFIVVHGTGVQTAGGNRWGDYSSMSIDPGDDCTFWYTQEYYKTTSSAGWNTRINSFKFPGCS